MIYRVVVSENFKDYVAEDETADGAWEIANAINKALFAFVPMAQLANGRFVTVESSELR